MLPLLVPQTIDRNASRLSFPNVAELIQEGHHVEEPNRVIFPPVFVIKIRVVVRRGHAQSGHFSIARAAHRFRKTNKLGLLCASRPIIAIATERNDPLFGIRAIQEYAQPSFEPSSRTERTRRID